MASLCGFVPWIVYWVLVSNVPFAVAAVMALAVAVLSVVVGRINGKPARALEIGSIGTFSTVTVLALALNPSFVARWILPLSVVGILITVLVVAATGKTLVGEPAPAGPGADATRTELLVEMNSQLTQLWAVTLAAMAVSVVIPPIVLSGNLIEDATAPVSIAFSWVIPFALFSVAALASRVLEDRVTVRLASPETVRRTTFVAFRELAIDELYYLAREKAEREVGAGMEAYDVKLGRTGISLTGDESRESWPATYKVRARR